jgi:predicted extracellular nuclease
MKYLSLLATIILVISIQCTGQKPDKEFTVVFYNVENLFDTEDEPGKEDNDYTPESALEWNQKKYEKKLNDIARVISSINPAELPEIVGLSEIENNKVLDDLKLTEPLKAGNYSAIHFDSPDERGIDVALIYRPDEFTAEDYKAIPVVFPFDSTETTRDILYVRGKTKDGDTLHFFVNHWKSRSEGVQETEPRRIYTAVILRKEIDLLMNKEPDAKILIMGDLNDEPTNRSIHEMLFANNKRKNATSRELYNLMYDLHNTGNNGTYFYKGTWNMLDNLIISRSLLNDKSGYHTDYDGGNIFRQDWMLYKDEKYNESVPNRTYGGPQYYGGISDHFPIYVTLKKEE